MVFSHEGCVAALGRLVSAMEVNPTLLSMPDDLTPREQRIFRDGVAYAARALENARCSEVVVGSIVNTV